MAKQKTERTCADCIHEYSCQLWTIGSLRNMNATTCPGYETVKDSAAYLCGVLDERKRKKTNADRIRKMDDKELRQFLCGVAECSACRWGKGDICTLGAWLKQSPDEEQEDALLHCGVGRL